MDCGAFLKAHEDGIVSSSCMPGVTVQSDGWASSARVTSATGAPGERKELPPSLVSTVTSPRSIAVGQ